MSSDPRSDESTQEDEQPLEGDAGAVKVVAAAIGLGLIVVAFNLAAYILNTYSFLYLFPFSPDGQQLDLSLDSLTQPILIQLAPFLAIFAVAAWQRLNPFRGGVRMLILLFVAGVLLSTVTFGIENRILLPILEPYSASTGASLSAQVLSFAYAESLIYQGVEFLFLALTALTMGYFWSENPLWRPWAWLHQEDDDGVVDAETAGAKEGE